MPLLVEDDQQALAHRIAAAAGASRGLRPAWCGRPAIRRSGRRTGRRPWTCGRGGARARCPGPGGRRGRGGLPACRPPRPRAGRAGATGTGRRRSPADPGVGGEDQVAERLDERPLAVDRLVQQSPAAAAVPARPSGPRAAQDLPRLAEPGRVPGRILTRSGSRRSSSASISGAMSTPLMVTFMISPVISTLTSSTPRIATRLRSTPLEPGTVQVAGPELGAGRSARSNRAPRRSAAEKSAMADPNPARRHSGSGWVVGVVPVEGMRRGSPGGDGRIW